MADNVAITPGTGATIATDDIGGVQYQRIKVALGADGEASDLAPGQATMAASVPVAIASNQSAVPVSGSVSVSGSVAVTGPATDAQLRATPLPVSGTVTASGPLTDAQLRAAAVPVTVGNFPATQPVSGPLTDTQLRASAVPVSAAALPLPADAATETTLAAIAADVDRLPVLVAGRMPVDGSGVTQPVSGSVSVSNFPATQPVSGSVSVTGGVAVNNFPTQSALTFTQPGVIAVNTDLLVIDCNGIAAVSIQCNSMGTSGVVTPAFSNDGTNYVSTSILTQAGAVAATFNAAGFWTTPVLGRFLRLRLTTATTGGTTTLAVQGIPVAASIPLVSQPVNVTNTVPVSGSLTSAGTTTNTPVTPTTTLTNSAATTNAANLKNSAGTVWSVVAYNASASPRYVKLYNLATAPTVGTTVPAMVLAVPATSTVQFDGGTNGIRFATGIGIGIVTGAADTDTTAPGASEVKVATSWT